VTKLVKGLRKAGGKRVRIVGTTYPDVLLGAWVRPPVNQEIAKLSVIAFQSVINPALKSAYASANGKFVDVTAATGAYGSLDEMTTLDYVYVTNWSLWWDIKILIKTIPAVLARKGAY